MKHLSRRTVLAGAPGAAFALRASARPVFDPIEARLAALERVTKGRLGVAIYDRVSGKSLGRRINDRFAMCSTFKLPLVAFVLREADRGTLDLERIVPYTEADLVPHAPVTQPNLAKGGMTIRDLAEAAQKHSDNVAANLLLKLIGGPERFTVLCRELGDGATRLDRYEPEMNDVASGDLRDTTTPAAMAELIARILFDGVLQTQSRELLLDWLVTTSTGLKRIRAGLPAQWRAGDKTGTAIVGGEGKYNDVAVAWPKDRPPLIVAAYFNVRQSSERIDDRHQAVLADVGRIAAASAGGP